MSVPPPCQPPPTVHARPAVIPPDWATSGVDKATSPANIDTMDRRTFVLLTGTVSSGLIRPPRGVRRSVGTLRFELDDRRRWSLWYYGDAQPVAVIRDAELVAWVGDRPL